MQFGIYLVLFVTAILGTAALVWIGASGGIGGVSVPAKIGVVLGAMLFVVWGLVGINAFEITVTSGGQEFIRSYEQLAWLSVIGGVVALYVMLQAAVQTIEDTGGI